MRWPTWYHAAVLATSCGVVAFALGRARTGRLERVGRVVRPAAHELALMSVLYAVWRLARVLPLERSGGAIDRAHTIVAWQEWLQLPSELSLQRFVLRHDLLAQTTNAYYAVAHVPALLVCLVWLWVRHRESYGHWRNGLVFVTACCLFIRFVRVAPPRFLGELGYVDLSTMYGMSVYGPVGTGVSDQFAAMPSIHVAWAAVVSMAVVSSTTSRWRWVVGLHVVVTMLVVSATGNHWWLDGIVAMVLLAVGLAADTALRSARARRQAQVMAAEPRAVPLDDALGSDCITR